MGVKYRKEVSENFENEIILNISRFNEVLEISEHSFEMFLLVDGIIKKSSSQELRTKN